MQYCSYKCMHIKIFFVKFHKKSVFLPYSIYQNNGEKGLYKVYLEEIETIIKEAEKVEFKEAD